MAEPRARQDLNDVAPLPLVVREQDLPPEVKAHVAALQQQRRVLGDDEKTAHEWVIEALPAVLARRVARLIPADFELVEMQMKVAVSGTPFGVGLGGEALITLRKAQRE